MKRRTCGQLVVVAPLANCEGTRHCSTNLAAPRCPRSKKHKMICGSDNQFYSNECQMKRENCGFVSFNFIILQYKLPNLYSSALPIIIIRFYRHYIDFLCLSNSSNCC